MRKNNISLCKYYKKEAMEVIFGYKMKFVW